MDLALFLLFVMFVAVDLILIYKPVPILAFPIMIFFLYYGITNFLPETELLYNPSTSFFFLLLCSIGLLVNALDYNRK